MKLLLSLALATVLSACSANVRVHDEGAGKHTMAPRAQRALCVLTPTEGNTARGTVEFIQHEDHVEIIAEVTGLTPGKHGFHVHEWGDVNCMDGKCTGGHFNPTGAPHAGPDAAKRHVGDLGNIEADANGHGVYHRNDKVISLNGANSIVGRAIIVHAGEDDLKSQPTGDAGSRVAYGVIGIAPPAD